MLGRRNQFFPLVFLVSAFFFNIHVIHAQNNEEGISPNSLVVHDISSTEADSDKIRVSWTIPDDFKAKRLVVYRDTVPFSSKKQLEDSKIVAVLTGKSIFYIDTVTTYQDFYYAVITETEENDFYDVIIPSVNATIKGTGIKRPATVQTEKEISEPKFYEQGSMREIPLPYLGIISDFDRKPTVFSEKTMKIAEKLSKKSSPYPEKQKLAPYFFEEDMISPVGGDDYFLFEILKTTFAEKDYLKSSEDLFNFLRVNRSAGTTDRAIFYLAQSQYFLGNYKNAVSMFLMVEETFPVLSRKWINSSLDFYEIPED